MKSKRLGTAVLAVVGLSGFAASGQTQKVNPRPQATRAQQNVPAEYQAGIAELRVAKGYLEKAGDKWGGYRVKGIASMNQAFKALGVSPESTPTEMQSGNVDEPGMMDSALPACKPSRKTLRTRAITGAVERKKQSHSSTRR